MWDGVVARWLGTAMARTRQLMARRAAINSRKESASLGEGKVWHEVSNPSSASIVEKGQDFSGANRIKERGKVTGREMSSHMLGKSCGMSEYK